MGNTAISKKNQPPPIDPVLQNKLVAKFGTKLMKQGFTALPVLVQKYYRYVPGNVFPHEVVDVETGEITIVERISYMTPTEYALMTAIWSYWWSHQSNPWPSVEHICEQTKKSERQVRRYLERLRNKGFMLSLEQFASDGKQISNRYDFTPFLKRLIAYLDALEQREKRMQQPTRDDTFDRERMTDEAGRGCQIRQGIEDESDINSYDEENSDSSGSAASPKGMALGVSMGKYSHIAHETIRSAEEDVEDTEETNAIESHRTSNLCVTEKEMASAAHAKEVERASDSKKLTPFERTALKAGVPLDLVDAMQTWYQACPRPQKHPMSVEGMITTCSQELGNMVNLQSNLTQATKLFRYAQLKGFTEDDFRVWFYDAAKRARREGITNKMAYFFTALKVELLVALVGSQWPPQPPEPDENEDGEEKERESVDQTDPQDAVEASQEEPQDDVNEEAGVMDMSPSLEVSDASVRETEQEAAPTEPLIFCDDPTSGWPTYETACWWADRLRDTLGAHIYTYTIRATEHGKWAFVFFVGNDISRGETFFTGPAVSYCLHHGWQLPQEEQS